jgi:hypothetical protein
MYRLQVIHIHNKRVEFEVAGVNEAGVKWLANEALDQADAHAGSLCHYVGLLAAGEAAVAAPHQGPHQKGRCPVCDGVYPVRKNGKLAKHGKVYGRRTENRCAGSGKAPRPLDAPPLARKGGNTRQPRKVNTGVVNHFYGVCSVATGHVLDVIQGGTDRHAAYKAAQYRVRTVSMEGTACYARKLKGRTYEQVCINEGLKYHKADKDEAHIPD